MFAEAVRRSIEKGTLTPTFATALHGKHHRVRERYEGQFWDYKERLDLDSALGRARLAKQVLAFHNASGGLLIFGVSDDHIIRGLTTSVPDSATVNNALRKYVGPSAVVSAVPVSVPGVAPPILVLLIPRRKGSPVPAQTAGPSDKGVPAFQKGDYFLRVEDQCRVIVDPDELRALLPATDRRVLNAYAFDRDETYFRVFRHHCDQFVGRATFLAEVSRRISGKHPVISLEGLGGVGKSALAIEYTQQALRNQSFQFIVSTTAKSSIWTDYAESRKAGFSGLTEFLQQVAEVLGIDPGLSTPDLKREINEMAAAYNGLILLDNAESVDASILSYLCEELPGSTKVLITSRVDRRFGAASITIEGMTTAEARDLFLVECVRSGIVVDLDGTGVESESARNLLDETGRLPLAIRWAVGLVLRCGSPRDALRAFRSSRGEFVSFCIENMFEPLPQETKEVALLAAEVPFQLYRPEVLGVLLGREKEDIERSLEMLRTAGLLMVPERSYGTGEPFVRLVTDYLYQRWNEVRLGFRAAVDGRLRALTNVGMDALAERSLAEWSKNLLIGATRARRAGNLETARRLLRATESLEHGIAHRLEWAAILLSLGKKTDALDQASVAMDAVTGAELADERVELAALFLTPPIGSAEQKVVLRLLQRVTGSPTLSRELLQSFIDIALALGSEESIEQCIADLTKEKDPQKMRAALATLAGHVRGTPQYETYSAALERLQDAIE